ncbi:MAG TPA: GDP-L-fucose synthase [Gemmatimonadaceae bacterium]|nr:GDP-L-fucose synthase [Gemmatimonadaceae bacterium]
MTPVTPAKCYVAGHRGLVGSALVRALHAAGYPAPIVRLRAELDLLDQRAVRAFFSETTPEVVFVAAARVGGIQANNSERWDFIHQNLVIETNILGAALETGVERLVFFGSSCIYPRLSPQPIREDYLLTGPLEETNEPYAIAKIAGVKMVEAAVAEHGVDWVSVMPTNLYGPNDNFDLETSHVLPALIRKFHEAREARESGRDEPVVLWGTGTARREFLHVDDAARAAIQLMESRATGLFNVGYGEDLPVSELASLVSSVLGYDGPVRWDSSRPDGTPRKLLDSSRILATGWAPRIPLEDGIRSVYEWYREASESMMTRAGH